MREEIINKTASELRERGFTVSLFTHTNSCFDIIAKSPVLILAIKVFENIDAMRSEHAEELKKLEQLLNVKAVIIGKKSKEFELKQGITYERYEIPALSFETFIDLLNEKVPYIKYYKGKNIVEINNDLLKEKRQNLGLSLSDMANELSLAKETLHKFEHGHRTTLETAEKLEKFLQCNLIRKHDLFEQKELEEKNIADLFEEHLQNDALAKIHELGIQMTLFRHAPFEAFASSQETLMIGLGKSRPHIERKSIALEKAKNVLKSHSMILAKQTKAKSLRGSAIIGEDELTTMHKMKDLLKVIREREKGN